MTDLKQFVQSIATACDDKGAENIVALDMESVSLVTDYFVICHASNERQVQAIARSVRDAVEEAGKTVHVMEGYDQARWIVLDVENVICHIFHQEERTYYNLDRLWGDAPHLPLEFGDAQGE